MKIAFYAPMKAPDHPRPSGDRLIARQLVRALEHAGHRVTTASDLRAWDGRGDARIQQEIRRHGTAEAERLIAQADPRGRPDLWFTYHLFHKAPDWIGPRVAGALNIPYVVAEASFAPKQVNGPWASGHACVADALRAASAVIALNPDDIACVLPLLRDGTRLLRLDAFIDTNRWQPPADRAASRAIAATRCGLDPKKPWLISVAMMRPGDKLTSYRQLAQALEQIDDLPWQLAVVGDGDARPETERAFADFASGRIHFLGQRDADAIAQLHGAADLFVWPAVNEAIGMAMLEAQACGLPVVAGAPGAVDTVITHNTTGLLSAPDDLTTFATHIRHLIGDPTRRRAMGDAAASAALASHSIDTAAVRLNALFKQSGYSTWP